MALEGFQGKLIQRQSALPWHYGIDMSAGADRVATAMSWKALAADKPKSRLISVICSNKVIVPHHRQRLAFVNRLKERLGSQVEVFGRGFNEISDKAEAIAPYRYHIVLENNTLDHFWTEKLADAWLGDAFPIYAGSGNCGDYFNSDSFFQVDIEDADNAIDQIEALMASNTWEQRRELIRDSRRKVMENYNLFAEVHTIISQATVEQTQAPLLARPQKVRPSSSLGVKNNIRRTLRYLRRMPRTVFHSLVPEHTRLAWRLKWKNKSPFLFVDFNDALGKRAKNLGYHSQRGQDFFVDQLFKHKKSGFFVGVGANHPTLISNTWFFEQSGWQGLSFEPQDKLYELFKQVRHTDILPYVLGASDGEVEFATVDTEGWQHALSGVLGVAELAVPALENHKVVTSKKQMRRLDDVLIERGIDHVDFMSIDVEGFEMDVLRGLDLRRVSVDVLIIENDRTPFGDQGMRDFVMAQGYRYIARLSGDDVFRATPK